MTAIRVMLADDHSLFRAGVRVLLEAIEGVKIVGEARDGPEVLRMVAELTPDVVLLDVALPQLNGIEVAERLVREAPGTRVLMLSMFANEEHVLRSLRAGAAGYLLKDSTVVELESALRSVAEGGSYLSPAVSGHVLAAYVRRVGQDVPPEPTLTPRQREVLQLIAEGHGTKEIADRLCLSTKTVETHRAQLMERLGIRDVAGLVRYAVRTGIVSADQV
jgi:DNA-binding NarL/FixJ family response regulator